MKNRIANGRHFPSTRTGTASNEFLHKMKSQLNLLPFKIEDALWKMLTKSQQFSLKSKEKAKKAGKSGRKVNFSSKPAYFKAKC